MWCASKVGNKQVIEDPNVAVFNVHRYFFLNVLTRACAEYVLFISKTPGADSLAFPVPFIAKAESNIDFAWVCHFLYDAGFFVLDFLQSVRANKSRNLDVLFAGIFCFCPQWDSQQDTICSYVDHARFLGTCTESGAL